MRRVLATAGHVDHGKSTLVRALTGRDPDRLDQEKERGLTIELGFAWTTLPSGAEVAFVDVPGHRRFIGTMLTGLGPAPAVVFVVAADQGWQEQSTEHLAAVDALGVEHVLLVVTRADLADPAPVLAEATARLAASGRGEVPAVSVSAVTGEGLDELRTALDALVTGLPAPEPTAPVRLWVDRAFTVGGSGTVVTGTVGAGELRVGDELELLDTDAPDARPVPVGARGLHSQDEAVEQVGPVSRAAVNLRRVERGAVGRGAVLLTPGAWELAAAVDLAVDGAGRGRGADGQAGVSARGPRDAVADLPTHAMLHVGTADHEVRLRPLAAGTVRATLPTALPWRVGDRVILRDPGTRHIVGATVLDLDPLPLRRRGAARQRGEALADAVGRREVGDAPGEVARAALRALRLTARHVEPATRLERMGLSVPGDSAPAAPAEPLTDAPAPAEVAVGELAVDGAAWACWRAALSEAVTAHHGADPLSAGLPVAEAADRIGLPGTTSAEQRTTLVSALVAAAGLEVAAGRVRDPHAGGLGAAEPGIAQVEAWLREEPFAAPEARELDDLGLGPKELAAAARTGRLLRLPGEVVLLPDGPARAMLELAALEQPFTLSAARQALGTTRRVAVPLLEHLDSRGWTRRVDGQQREVVR
ncbi:SelB domain-containing protein [Kytococcus sp. Marseille-QA3725]